jgi:hypothetical protein
MFEWRSRVMRNFTALTPRPAWRIGESSDLAWCLRPPGVSRIKRFHREHFIFFEILFFRRIGGYLHSAFRTLSVFPSVRRFMFKRSGGSSLYHSRRRETARDPSCAPPLFRYTVFGIKHAKRFRFTGRSSSFSPIRRACGHRGRRGLRCGRGRDDRGAQGFGQRRAARGLERKDEEAECCQVRVFTDHSCPSVVLLIGPSSRLLISSSSLHPHQEWRESS